MACCRVVELLHAPMMLWQSVYHCTACIEERACRTCRREGVSQGRLSGRPCLRMPWHVHRLVVHAFEE